MKVFPLCLVCLMYLPRIGTADYSPRDFLSQAPAETFSTEDELSEVEKQRVANSKFIPSTSFTCEAWEIADESPTSLTLRICPDSFVRIQLFHQSSGDTIVGVESNRSAGRAFDLRFFLVAGPRREISELNDTQLKALGIDEVSENELLAPSERFPPATARMVSLSLDEEGRPKATLRPWEEPRWEKRRVAFEPFFEWDGARFHKRVKNAR